MAIVEELKFVGGFFSLVIVEQILNLKLDVDEQFKEIIGHSLKIFWVLVLGAQPCLKCSIEFMDLFCEILNNHFEVLVLAISLQHFNKFIKSWLLVQNKTIDNKLLNSILKYIMKEDGLRKKRIIIAEYLTAKDFLNYFHNSIKNVKAFHLVCSALELSTKVHILSPESYSCWIYEAIIETDEIVKKRLVTLYYYYRLKAGHNNSHILQDVIKAFSSEDTVKKLNIENVEVICENIDYIKNPLNLINDCILEKSFNFDFGHISFIFLNLILKVNIICYSNNIEEFFNATLKILMDPSYKAFEKCQIMDIILSTRTYLKRCPEIVSIEYLFESIIIKKKNVLLYGNYSCCCRSTPLIKRC